MGENHHGEASRALLEKKFYLRVLSARARARARATTVGAPRPPPRWGGGLLPSRLLRDLSDWRLLRGLPVPFSASSRLYVLTISVLLLSRILSKTHLCLSIVICKSLSIALGDSV